MQCVYCRFTNSEDDHRCRRCGRRVESAVAASDLYEAAPYSGGSLAMAPRLQMMHPEPDEPEIIDETVPAAPLNGRQQSLFLDDEGRKVLEFPAPRKVAPKRGPDATVRPKRRPVAVESSAQPSLDFLPVATHAPRTLRTKVEASIGCEAPVATPIHRIFATTIDAALILIAYVGFLAVFFLAGGEMTAQPVTFAVLGGSLAVIAAFYGLCYALGNSETSGYRWAELRLISFDGGQLGRRERLIRYGWSCFLLPSLVSMAWALVDEETLAMHDHAAKSFPTPR